MPTKPGPARCMLLALSLSLAGASSALSHDVEKGPNGGQVVDVKGHHVELTVSESAIKLYLSDQAHAPIASQGATGRAVILAGGKQSTVELKPADPNLMTGTAETSLSAGARLVISTKLRDGHELQARFVLK